MNSKDMKQLLFLLLLIPGLLFGQGKYRVIIPPKPLAVEEDDFVAKYLLDGDITDETGNFDGTEVGTMYYGGSNTYALFSESDGNDGFYVGTQSSLVSNTGFTVKYDIQLNEDLNEDYNAHGTSTGGAGDGFRVEFDGTGANSFNWLAEFGDGSSGDWATTLGGSYQSNFTTGTWYEIFEVYDCDGTTMYVQLWVDGVQWNTSDTVVGSSVGPLNTSKTWYFGRGDGSSGGLREGCLLDNVVIWDRRLTSSEITGYTGD